MGNIKIFENKKIRTHWDAEKEEWYFSVVDVCGVLSGSTAKDAGAYWRKLKQRLKAEGSELVTKCHGLKMLAEDGKLRETDVLDTQGILRLVQSIPSPNALASRYYSNNNNWLYGRGVCFFRSERENTVKIGVPACRQAGS